MDEGEGILCTPFSVHARIFPFDREWSLVADAVELANDGLEIDVTVSGGDEVPTSLLLAEVEVRAQDTGAAIEFAF